MKLSKLLGISIISATTMVVVPLCSCVTETKQQNLITKNNISVENYKAPNDKYAIEKVKKWGSTIYQNCWMLDNTNASDKSRVTSIPTNKFQGNKQLEHISYSKNSDVSSELTTISKASFQGCSNLKSIAIPTTITKIEDRAFFRCSNLKEISFADFKLGSSSTVSEIEKLSAKLASLSFGKDAFAGVPKSGTLVLSSIFFNDDKNFISPVVENNLFIFGNNLYDSGLGKDWLSSSNIYLLGSPLDENDYWDWDAIDVATTKIENGSLGLKTVNKYWNGDEDISKLIGMEGYVTVNSQPHKVRIIGTNHDTTVDADGYENGTAIFTFEFANTISDSTGKELAITWNGDGDSTAGSKHYQNSTLFDSLNSTSTVNWYKSAATSSFSGKSVNSMLVEGTPKLANKIQTVKKYFVECQNNTTWIQNSYNAQLFNLTAKELNWSPTNTSDSTLLTSAHNYEYYSTASSNIVKKWPVVYSSHNTVKTDATGSAGTVHNYAQTWTNENGITSYYWIASPNTSVTTQAGFCNEIAQICCNWGVHESALGVAPCFCVGRTTNFEDCNWNYLNSKALSLENGGTPADFCSKFKIKQSDGTYKVASQMSDFIGQTKTVRVNNVDHKVRVVGTSSDDTSTYQVNYLSDGITKAALTFEFASLISDSNGYSLSTLWNDTGTASSSNYDYLNSTIRHNLNGTWGSGTEPSYQWFEKSKTTKSTTYTGSVLNMLDSNVQNSIKTTNHVVLTKSSSTTVQTSYSDKLFLPTFKEMYGSGTTYCETTPKPYYYYKNATDLASARIKQQVMGSTGALTTSTRISGIAYSGGGTSTAGYNDPTTGNGSMYYLATPYYNGQAYAYRMGSGGAIPNNSCVYNNAYPIAPMFCI